MATNLDISAGLANANTTFQVAHAELFTQATLPGPYQLWTEVVSNAGALERNFLAELPRTQLWTHPLGSGGLRHYSYTITPRSYAARLEIYRLDLQRDKTGVLGQTIAAWLGRETDAHHVAVTSSMDGNSGAGDFGYDGVRLFSASHPHLNSGAGASNLSAGTNLSHANYVAARAAGMSIKDAKGVPMGIAYTDMRVGPLLESRAREVTGANIVVKHYNASGVETTAPGAVHDSVGMDNVHRGEVRLTIDPYIGSDYYWDLFDLSKHSKPMCLVTERPLQPLPNPTDMGAQRRTDHDIFLYGHDGEYAAAPAVSIYAYRGTGTA